MLRCPQCNIELYNLEAAGASVAGCHFCGGAWLPNDTLTWLAREHPLELGKIDNHFRVQWAHNKEEREVPLCAYCGADLLPHEFVSAPGISMRVCAPCKMIWLGDGQLAQLQSIVAPAPTVPTAPEAPPEEDSEPAPAEPKDLRERIIATPLGVVAAVMGAAALLKPCSFYALHLAGVKGFGGYAQKLASEGLPVIATGVVVTMVLWMLHAVVLWIGIWIAAGVTGEAFELEFEEGIRPFLPVAMILQVVSELGLVISVATATPAVILAMVTNLLILRYFLDLEWLELVIISVVMSFLGSAPRVWLF